MRLGCRWTYGLGARPPIVATILATIFSATQAGAAMADIIVPPAQSTFHACDSPTDVVVTGLGSIPVSCVKNSFQGDMIIGTLTATGTAATFVTSSGAPTAMVEVDSATTGPQGGGLAEGEAHLIYYIGLDTIGTAPFLPDAIPVDFEAVGDASGNADGNNTEALAADINVVINGFTNVDGPFVSVDIGDTQQNSLEDHVHNTGVLVFDPSEGPAIAQVKLDVICDANGSVNDQLGFTNDSSHISCSADPLIGFDQSAFDAAMGPNTFHLADYFSFVFSDGLAAPTAAVPEPDSLELLGPGLFLLGFAWRQRARS